MVFDIEHQAEEQIPNIDLDFGEPYMNDDGRVGYHVKHEGKDVATVILDYDEGTHEVSDEYIEAGHDKVYGTNIMRAVPNLPLPDGRTFDEAGYKFVSASDLDIASEDLWETLVLHGEAKIIGPGRYQFIPISEAA